MSWALPSLSKARTQGYLSWAPPTPPEAGTLCRGAGWRRAVSCVLLQVLLFSVHVSLPPCRVTDQLLRELFEPYGTVLHTAVLQDSVTGASRGFGFVHMGDEATATAAKEASGRMVEGRPLIVRLKTEAPSGPGGRRGGWLGLG